MRYFLIALMIVLLPLRGWTSDAMATEMAAPTLVHQLVVGHSGGGGLQANAAASPTHVHGTSVPAGAPPMATADCIGHAGSPDPASTDASHCASCVVCQACYSVALVLPRFDSGIAFTSPVLLLSDAASFTSAERALGLKPPIS